MIDFKKIFRFKKKMEEISRDNTVEQEKEIKDFAYSLDEETLSSMLDFAKKFFKEEGLEPPTTIGDKK